MPNAFPSLIGIDLPIVQAPMGSATCPALAAAVSNAGALGMLALGWMELDEMRASIRATRALTDRPFGVNLVLTEPQEDRVALCVEEGVPVISFFWGRAGEALTAAARRGGGKVLHTVGSDEEARRVVGDGADVVVAQGLEAGGHVWGTVSTLALVPVVVDAVGSVPVVAAGGLADGRGLAAVMALGAAGGWIGTRFLASHEAAIHPRYREHLLAARATDTEYGTLFDVGWPDAPHRFLRNSTVEAWEAAGRPPAGRRPGEGQVLGRDRTGDVVRYQSGTPHASFEGEVEPLSLWAGQGVGLVRRVQPAAEIVREIVDEAEAVLTGLASKVRG
jgi:NAD(P)H-dependent flavin oxidoreductase YrpB (nitropropane dioxygenase family)